MSKEIKISTYIAPLTRLGTPELVVDTLKEAGFRYYDFTMMFPIMGFELFYNSDDYFEKAKHFRDYTDKIGIYCNQTHGCVPCLPESDLRLSASDSSELLIAFNLSSQFGIFLKSS